MTLYVETNFLVGIATGREPRSGEILARVGSEFKLAIPSICFFEAYSWWEGERKRRASFDRSLGEQVRELYRDLTSNHARALRSLLSQSQVENKKLSISTTSRLEQAVSELSQAAEPIDLRHDVLERSTFERIIDERTDNLILHCILDHARAAPSETKLLLSGNTKEFGVEDVKSALHEAGVQYFAESQNVLGWLQSQPNP